MLCLEQATGKERSGAVISSPAALERALRFPTAAQGAVPASEQGTQLYLQRGNLPCARESSLPALGQQKRSQFPALHGGGSAQNHRITE